MKNEKGKRKCCLLLAVVLKFSNLAPIRITSRLVKTWTDYSVVRTT